MTSESKKHLRWVVFLAASMIAASKAAPAGWEIAKVGGLALHKASQVGFPAVAAGLKRSAIKADGSAARVEYLGAEFPLEISVTIVPRKVNSKASLDSSMKESIAEIQRNAGGVPVNVKESGPARLPISDLDVDGQSAYVELTRKRKPLGVWLFFVPLAKYELRVRSEYEAAAEGGESGRRLRLAFNQSLAVLRELRFDGAK